MHAANLQASMQKITHNACSMQASMQHASKHAAYKQARSTQASMQHASKHACYMHRHGFCHGSGAAGLRRSHATLSSQIVLTLTTAASACWPAPPANLSRGGEHYKHLLLSSRAASPLRASSSSSSAYCSPLLDVGLPQGTPQDPISRFSHPSTASYPLQVIGPSGRRASDTTFAEPWPPFENPFTPPSVGSATDVTSPLPLQFATFPNYVSS